MLFNREMKLCYSDQRHIKMTVFWVIASYNLAEVYRNSEAVSASNIRAMSKLCAWISWRYRKFIQGSLPDHGVSRDP